MSGVRATSVNVNTGALGYQGDLSTSDTARFGGTLTLAKTGQPDVALDNVGGVGCVTAPLAILGAGNGLRVAEGSNAKMGTATLVAGTTTVATTAVATTSRIFLTVQALGTVTAPKPVAVTARVAGTSFTITSSDNTDTSVVAWMIVDPS